MNETNERNEKEILEKENSPGNKCIAELLTMWKIEKQMSTPACVSS